jgi:O-antigen/teichoic acid export membrane protein
MGIVTAVHHVGYNWSAFVQARGITWPVAVSGVVVCATVIAAGIPLMYSHGPLGLAYAFAIGECVSLAIRGVWLTRFFEGVSILTQLWRGLAPAALAAGFVLLERALLGADGTPAHAIAVLLMYLLVCVGATYLLERRLLREAVGYMLSRRDADVAAGGELTAPVLVPAVSE